MPEPMDDLPSLKALQKKIDKAKGTDEQESLNAVEYNRDISMAVRFLVELVAGLAVGGLLGYYTDKWLESSPVGLIIGLILGMVAGIRNMMRNAKQEDKQ